MTRTRRRRRSEFHDLRSGSGAEVAYTADDSTRTLTGTVRDDVMVLAVTEDGPGVALP